MKHYSIKVIGKVQGVWFRKYTFDKANEMQLKGFVQNETDGSVYIEVEDDDAEKIKRFITWLHTGSPMSKVTKVVSEQSETIVGFDSFEIRR
jgi:acylphosphatase